MGRRPVVGVTFAGEERGYVRSEAGYLAALEAAGAEPRILRPGVERDPAAVLRSLDGLLLSGGDDLAPEYYGEAPHPRLGFVNGPRDRMEMLLGRAALAGTLPVLGICNGLQILNVLRGGSLWQDLPSQAPGPIAHGGGTSHAVTILPGTRLASLAGAGERTVNSFHHQAVRRVGAGLVAAARSADGVVEALEGPPGRFLLGVQWHPERPGCEGGTGAALVEALVEAASASIPFRVAGAP